MEMMDTQFEKAQLSKEFLQTRIQMIEEKIEKEKATQGQNLQALESTLKTNREIFEELFSSSSAQKLQ